jgi:hypothetical protein
MAPMIQHRRLLLAPWFGLATNASSAECERNPFASFGLPSDDDIAARDAFGVCLRMHFNAAPIRLLFSSVGFAAGERRKKFVGRIGGEVRGFGAITPRMDPADQPSGRGHRSAETVTAELIEKRPTLISCLPGETQCGGRRQRRSLGRW